MRFSASSIAALSVAGPAAAVCMGEGGRGREKVGQRRRTIERIERDERRGKTGRYEGGQGDHLVSAPPRKPLANKPPAFDCISFG